MHGSRTPRTPKSPKTPDSGVRSKSGITIEYLMSRAETGSQQIAELQKWNEELQYIIDKNEKDTSIRIDHLEDTINSMTSKLKLQETKIEYLTFQNKQLQQLMLSLPQQNNIDEVLMNGSPRGKKLEEEISRLEEQTSKIVEPLRSRMEREQEQEEEKKISTPSSIASPTKSPKNKEKNKSYYDVNTITDRFKKRQSQKEDLNRSSSNIVLDDDGIIKLPTSKHRIVTGGETAVKVWDSGSTRSYLDKEFKGHLKFAWSLDRLYNGDICSASADHTIRIWDYESATCKRIIRHPKEVNSILASQFVLFSGCEDSQIRCFNVVNGSCLNMFSAHTKGVQSLCNISNNSIASGSGDSTIKIWDIEKVTCIRTFEGHSSTVFSLLYDRELNCLYSGGWDKNIFAWDLRRPNKQTFSLLYKQQNRPIKEFIGHAHNVNNLEMYNGYLTSASFDGTIRFWEPRSQDCILIAEAHESDITSMTQIGDYLVTSSNDKTVKYWKFNGGNELECAKVMHAGEKVQCLLPIIVK